MSAIIISLLLVYCHGFTITMSNKMGTNWNNLQFSVKESARKWFINRATKKGIPWNSLYDKNVALQEEIVKRMEQKEDKSISYPNYFIRPFHGYDDGNMNWRAVHEAEAATLSIAAGYWENIDPYITQEWMRTNITKNIKDYYENIQTTLPKKILDVGCSIGISTEFLYRDFHNISSIDGIDLSPYFIALADYRAEDKKLKIDYTHGNAENTPYFENTYNLIVCNFIFHELPEKAANDIMNELYRILSYDGVLAIVDMDPKHLDKTLNNNIFRKWAFESTEPHIYNYYLRDTKNMLSKCGFQSIEKRRNDPLNSVWLGVKRHDYSPLKIKTFPNVKKIEKTNNDNKNIINIKQLIST